MKANFTHTVGLLAGIIKIAAYVPYVWSTVNGATRPNRASWWIWAVLGAVSYASWRRSGEEAGWWIPAIMVAGPFFIGLLSLRYGAGGVSRLDRRVLAGTILAMALWGVTGDAALALFFNIMVDALAAVPTIHKAWQKPESESLPAWLLSFTAFGLNLLAIEKWTPFSAAYPLYLCVLAGSIITAILLGRRRRSKA